MKNYQRELEEELARIAVSGATPSLLLHSCCAPCSSYVLEYLSEHFFIHVLYFNPNIFPLAEHAFRMEEQGRLIREMGENRKWSHPVKLIETDYEPERFYEAVRGLEQIPEGGERCFACYRLRLEEAARYAKKLGVDYFTTTLSISPK